MLFKSPLQKLIPALTLNCDLSARLLPLQGDFGALTLQLGLDTHSEAFQGMEAKLSATQLCLGHAQGAGSM